LPQFVLSIEGENDRERQKEIEDDISNKATKWVHVTDKPVTSVGAQLNASQSKFLPDLDEIQDQISMGGGYTLDTAIKGGDIGFASAQTSMQDVAHKIAGVNIVKSSAIANRTGVNAGKRSVLFKPFAAFGLVSERDFTLEAKRWNK